MPIARIITQYLYAPLYFICFVGTAIWLVGNGADKVWIAMLFIPAIAVSFIGERFVPFEAVWNEPKGDVLRDWIHAIVNELSNILSIAAIPFLASLSIGFDIWPNDWPLLGQLAFTVLIADFGITMAHFISHKIEVIWRLHAVHHSVERMYGFNGLMKHPLHQGFELLVGTTPLLLMGMPIEIGILLGFAVAIQLMLQHSNVDMKIGPLIYLWAVAPGHRHHHVASKTKGDVNFGLFTMLWDHLLGTFVSGHPSPRDGDLGVAGRPDFPIEYSKQLVDPFINFKK